MGYTGPDPETTLRLLQFLLYCLACLFGGFALLGLSAYIALLSAEIFSPQPAKKTRPVEVRHPVGIVPEAEDNPDLAAAEIPVWAEGERLGEEAVRVPALPHHAQGPRTPVPVTLEREPALAAALTGGRSLPAALECESQCPVAEVSVTTCQPEGQNGEAGLGI